MRMAALPSARQESAPARIKGHQRRARQEALGPHFPSGDGAQDGAVAPIRPLVSTLEWASLVSRLQLKGYSRPITIAE